MKITYKKIVVCLLVATVFFAVPVFSAQAFEKYAKEKGEYAQKKMERLTAELGLTDEQKSEMQKLREESWEGKRELYSQLKAARKELREELKKPSSDRGKINDIVARMKDLQGEMIDNRVDHFLETKEVLTDEQFRKFQGLLKEKRDKVRRKIGERTEKRSRRKSY